MKTKFRMMVVAVPLVLVTAAQAQHQTFKINPDASSVSFTLASHDNVKGVFHIEKGTIDFDRNLP
jgi:polyisoprenoid-binding protein YceI